MRSASENEAKRKAISKGVRFDVFHRDGFKCRYCGLSQAQGAVLHVDHRFPFSKGGEDAMSNYVTACSDCNLGKSDKVLREGPDETKAEPETFGLSFDAEGRVQWQFVIQRATKYAAKIVTYSWLSGDEHGVQNVSMDFINNRCMLFTGHSDFIAAADYWSDARLDRVNDLFVE